MYAIELLPILWQEDREGEGMTDTTCRICGSKEIYCIQETSHIGNPWMIIHLAYCEKCAKDIEQYELQLIKNRRVKG